METAKPLAGGGIGIYRAGIWKPRTKPGGFEGVGTPGLAWLKRVKRETGMRLAVEVATRDHVFEALKAGIDLLWIGARTTANPFAVQEIADALRGTDLPVLVKNPVNPDLELWVGAFERLYGAGLRRLAAVHRGFGSYDRRIYRNAPLWQIPIELQRRIPELPIFCDPSHIGGRRELIEPLSRQAMELDFEGLLIESHYRPDAALSDAAQQVTPAELLAMLDRLVKRNGNRQAESLVGLRCQIDQIDEQLLELLARRMEVSSEIGAYKKRNDMPVLQADRYGEVLQQRSRLGEQMDLDPEFVREILEDIHEESVRRQMLVMER